MNFSVSNNNIPKIIHYCWFGDNSKPLLVEKCIQSWKVFLSDYEIREWNNSDIENCENQYVQEAFKMKKWAFVSDYFRLYALYNYGGIYLDTDNEVFKTFDDFLHLDFFSGYENWHGEVSPFTAVVGAKRGNHIIKDLLDEYDSIHFVSSSNKCNQCTNTTRVTKYFVDKYNFMPPYDDKVMKILEDNCIIYPSNIFCNYEKDVSYAVHHFNASWVENEPKLSWFQYIFSARNTADKKKKIIRILGIKITIKRELSGRKL